jgi:hypothetical protein
MLGFVLIVVLGALAFATINFYKVKKRLSFSYLPFEHQLSLLSYRIKTI